MREKEKRRARRSDRSDRSGEIAPNCAHAEPPSRDGALAARCCSDPRVCRIGGGRSTPEGW
eukprot:5058665-Alexandrium_andersonii.AAC.1